MGFVVDKREGSNQVCPDWSPWSWRQTNQKGNGILCDWLGENVWPSVIGPKLEGGHTIGSWLFLAVMSQSFG